MKIETELKNKNIPYKKVLNSFMVTLNKKTYDAILEMQLKYRSVNFVTTNIRFN